MINDNHQRPAILCTVIVIVVYALLGDPITDLSRLSSQIVLASDDGASPGASGAGVTTVLTTIGSTISSADTTADPGCGTTDTDTIGNVSHDAVANLSKHRSVTYVQVHDRLNTLLSRETTLHLIQRAICWSGLHGYTYIIAGDLTCINEFRTILETLPAPWWRIPMASLVS
jgi:hypothetical protein